MLHPQKITTMKKFGFLLLLALFAAFSMNATPNTSGSDSAIKDSIYQANKSGQTIDDEQNQKEAAEQFYENSKDDFAFNTSEILNKLVAILVPMMAFLTAIMIVYFVVRNNRLKEQRMIQLYEKALDAGKDLPDSFFKRSEKEPKSHFLKGLIWIGAGLGTSIGGIFLMGQHSPWGFGLIPLFVGIAYLISYFVEKENKANAAKDE